MLIQELSRQASLDLLARIRLGRLACAQGAQPYVTPIYFVSHLDCLYGFSTLGQKIEWLRANPLVCIEADEVVSAQEWVSLVVFGRYEELPDMPEWQSSRAFAHRLLKQYAVWWEPAYAKTILQGTQRPLVPIFYRIHIDRMTGHRATPEPASLPDTRFPMTDPGETGWAASLRRWCASLRAWCSRCAGGTVVRCPSSRRGDGTRAGSLHRVRRGNRRSRVRDVPDPRPG